MRRLRSGRIFKCLSETNLNNNTNPTNLYSENCDNQGSSNSNSLSDFSTADSSVSLETMANLLNVGTALKIVPEFSGESPRDLDRFISCCEIVVEPLDAPEKLKFIRLLNAKLTGKAHDVLQFNKFESFEELKQELISQFGESKSVESLTYELISVRQDNKEDVRSYANKIEKILSMLDSACIKREGTEAARAIRNLNASTALKSFEEGLREPIKLVIKASRFKTLKEAINAAVEEEIVVAQRRNLTQSNPSSNQNSQASKCNICHKSGHLANNCFKRQSNSNKPNGAQFRPTNPSVNNSNVNNTGFKFNNPNSNEVSNIRKINKFCNYCKYTGHVIDECRKRQHNNNLRSQSSNSSNANANTNVLQSENSCPLEAINATLRVQDL